jgi:hypothetical protein
VNAIGAEVMTKMAMAAVVVVVVVAAAAVLLMRGAPVLCRG